MPLICAPSITTEAAMHACSKNRDLFEKHLTPIIALCPTHQVTAALTQADASLPYTVTITPANSCTAQEAQPTTDGSGAGSMYFTCEFPDIDHIPTLTLELKNSSSYVYATLPFDRDADNTTYPTFVDALKTAEMPKANITAVVQAPHLTAGDNTSPVQYMVRACFV